MHRRGDATTLDAGALAAGVPDALVRAGAARREPARGAPRRARRPRFAALERERAAATLAPHAVLRPRSRDRRAPRLDGGEETRDRGSRAQLLLPRAARQRRDRRAAGRAAGSGRAAARGSRARRGAHARAAQPARSPRRGLRGRRARRAARRPQAVRQDHAARRRARIGPREPARQRPRLRRHARTSPDARSAYPRSCRCEPARCAGSPACRKAFPNGRPCCTLRSSPRKPARRVRRRNAATPLPVARRSSPRGSAPASRLARRSRRSSSPRSRPAASSWSLEAVSREDGASWLRESLYGVAGGPRPRTVFEAAALGASRGQPPRRVAGGSARVARPAVPLSPGAPRLPGRRRGLAAGVAARAGQQEARRLNEPLEPEIAIALERAGLRARRVRALARIDPAASGRAVYRIDLEAGRTHQGAALERRGDARAGCSRSAPSCRRPSRRPSAATAACCSKTGSRATSWTTPARAMRRSPRPARCSRSCTRARRCPAKRSTTGAARATGASRPSGDSQSLVAAARARRRKRPARIARGARATRPAARARRPRAQRLLRREHADRWRGPPARDRQRAPPRRRPRLRRRAQLVSLVAAAAGLGDLPVRLRGRACRSPSRSSTSASGASWSS